MTNLNDFWEGEEDVAVSKDTVLSGDARVTISADFAAPCYQCYRTDHTEYRQSKQPDSLDVHCSECNIDYTFRLPGLWRMLGLS